MEPLRNKMSRDDDKVAFHPEQLRWLEQMFPEVVPLPTSTPAEMYYRGGQRAVLAAVRAKVR